MKQIEAPVRAEMCRLYEEEGWSLRELAAKYGLTYEGVRYRLTAAGVQMRPRGLDGPPIDTKELRRLYVEELLPVGDVAKRFGRVPGASFASWSAWESKNGSMGSIW